VSIKELDKYCNKLLGTLFVSNRKWHFNELHNTLNKIDLKMSKPTLSKHLKHLQRLKFITRKREGKQQTSYQVNWEKLKYMQKTVESVDAIKRITENERNFSSFPIDEQVIFLTNVLSLRNLEQLKLQILHTLEPDKVFEHNVQYALTNQFFDLFTTWFARNCYKTSKENNLIALKTIETNIQHFEEDLFIRKPWRSHNEDTAKQSQEEEI
jgi:DNA-binding HxlR family transcriptional regulator